MKGKNKTKENTLRYLHSRAACTMLFPMKCRFNVCEVQECYNELSQGQPSCSLEFKLKICEVINTVLTRAVSEKRATVTFNPSSGRVSANKFLK
jgi:hypothetical protein